jgi:hypothetical protein
MPPHARIFAWQVSKNSAFLPKDLTFSKNRIYNPLSGEGKWGAGD